MFGSSELLTEGPRALPFVFFPSPLSISVSRRSGVGRLWDAAPECLLDLLPLRFGRVMGGFASTRVVEGVVGFVLGVVMGTAASALVELISVGVDMVEGWFGLLGV